MLRKAVKPIPFHESKKLSDWVLELLLPSSPPIKQDHKEQPVRKARRVPLDQLEQQGLRVLPALLVLQALLVPLVLLVLLDRLVRRVA